MASPFSFLLFFPPTQLNFFDGQSRVMLLIKCIMELL